METAWLAFGFTNFGINKENKSRDQQYAGCHSLVCISIRLLDTVQWNWLISCKLFDTNTTLYKAHNYCRGLENWGEPNYPLHLRKWPAFFGSTKSLAVRIYRCHEQSLTFDMKHGTFFEGALHKVKVDRVNGSRQPPNPDRNPRPNSVLMISLGLVWRVT